MFPCSSPRRLSPNEFHVYIKFPYKVYMKGRPTIIPDRNGNRGENDFHADRNFVGKFDVFWTEIINYGKHVRGKPTMWFCSLSLQWHLQVVWLLEASRCAPVWVWETGRCICINRWTISPSNGLRINFTWNILRFMLSQTGQNVRQNTFLWCFSLNWIILEKHLSSLEQQKW